MEKVDVTLFNTASKQKEVFTPIEPGKVRMYHCGPTVYWTQHIGNLRAVVMADIVVRTFEYLGYEVSLVRNFTDVGHLTSDEDAGLDKMEKGAKRENLSPLQIAEKYIEVYEHDVAQLNVRQPNAKPRATQHITSIIEMVQTLLDKGFAYQTDLAIYFDVTKATDYTRLTGASIDANLEGAGSGDISDPNKKHHADFSLWFFKAGAHANALQTWESPFISPLVDNGEGFPGWHIECSAMSKQYLGDTLDIHMGGIEHIPVHHTNEIAQSECANDTEFTHYWLHNEHLRVDGAKMSKSEGTSYTLKDITDKGFEPLSLRYFYFGSHYRSKQNFTWEAMQAAATTLTKLRRNVADLPGGGEMIPHYKQAFTQCLVDDFNITKALSVVFDVLRSDALPADKKATLLDFDSVLGLKLDAPLETDTPLPQDIQALIKKRDEARESKDWPRSDAIRNELESLGYEVQDTPEGTQVVTR